MTSQPIEIGDSRDAPERILMWWNFVGRDRAEIDAAYTSWRADDDRFGRVRSPLPRIPTGAPFWQDAPDGRP